MSPRQKSVSGVAVLRAQGIIGTAVVVEPAMGNMLSICRLTPMLALAALLLAAGGCASAPKPLLAAPPPQAILTTQPNSTVGLGPPTPIESVQTVSPIPIGWKPDPLKHNDVHDHQTWVSPSRRTAYGVISFHNWLLPLASDQLVLDKFLTSMKKSEGEAKLLYVEKNPDGPGLRFGAEGGLYTLYANLFTRGSQGWVIYAGTLRDKPPDLAELDLAKRARDQTVIGLPSQTAGK